VRLPVLLLLLSAACSQPGKPADGSLGSDTVRNPDQPPRPARIFLETPTGFIEVASEVVASPAKVTQGLMYRDHLDPNTGMLFLMGADDDWAFYMRNTLIPLDMIFITHDLEIAGIVENAEPHTETLRRVGRKSRYVLEVSGGWTSAHQVFPGARVRFEGVDPRTAQ
jgi:uncharacterized protein